MSNSASMARIKQMKETYKSSKVGPKVKQSKQNKDEKFDSDGQDRQGIIDKLSQLSKPNTNHERLQRPLYD